MMRLQVHIIPAHAAPSAAPVSTFLEVAPPTLSLEDLTSSITNRYRRLYPHRPPLRIDRLQDSSQNDLDLSYRVEDVFSDKASDTLSSIVRVVQASSVRESSIPPESGLRIGQSSGRKRSRPTGIMEAVREASSERVQPHSQPPSHSQSASLRPSRGSRKQRSNKRQKLDDFLVGDSMDERDENLVVRNWNDEVETDSLVDLGAGAESENYNYDVLGDGEKGFSKPCNSSSRGLGHGAEPTPTPGPNQIGPNDPNTLLGNRDLRFDPENPEPLWTASQVPASPELEIMGRTKVSSEGPASFDGIKHQSTSFPVTTDSFDKDLGEVFRPLPPSRGSRPLFDTPPTIEKLGEGKGAFAARTSRQTTAEKLAARAGRHITAEGPTTEENHATTPVLPTVKPSIYSVPASDEEDVALPLPTVQTPNSASRGAREPSIISETASEEADDESSQEILERRISSVEKESESEKQALREERESREREAKDKQDKEARELAAKAAEQREKAARELAAKAAEQRAKTARELAEKLKIEKERLEKERLEKERLEKERLEKERLEKERLEKERLEKERLEKERLEKERLEKERFEKERLEKGRLEKERLEKGRLEKERLEKEKLDKQRVAREKIAAEKAEREKIAQEKAAHEKTAQMKAAERAATPRKKIDQKTTARKAAEEALTALRATPGKEPVETIEGNTAEVSPLLKRKTRGAVNKGRVEEKTGEEASAQGQKTLSKQKKEQEALEKKEVLENKKEQEAVKQRKELEALEKKNKQKADEGAKKELAKEKKEREALERKKRLEEQKAEREAKKKEAVEERASKAKEKAENTKAEREKKKLEKAEELKLKAKDTPSQDSLAEGEPTLSQGMKSNLKGSAVKKHSTRVSFADADTSVPPASQKPTKQTPILPPGFERNIQEAPDWVNTRKTPPPPAGIKTSQRTKDVSEPLTNGITAKPKSNSKAAAVTTAPKAAVGKAVPIDSKSHGKVPASATKQSAKKAVELESESESGSETESETGSETGSEFDGSEAEATKSTPTTVPKKGPKTVLSVEDVEMPDAPSSPTPRQTFEVSISKNRNLSDGIESGSEQAPPSGQKPKEETESETGSDSKVSASGTDSGSDSESDSDSGKKKPSLAKTLFKTRTYGKRHSLSASQSIHGTQRYKSLTAMEMAPIPDVREVHQSSQSARNPTTPKANGLAKSQKLKKPAVSDDQDSEDSDSSYDSSGSSEEEEVEKPKNNALNGRMASGNAKRKSSFGGFGFRV